MPEFPDGGMPGLMNFLSNNIKYPVNAQKRGVQGRVSVQFIVNADGSISDVGIIRAVDPDHGRRSGTCYQHNAQVETGYPKRQTGSGEIYCSCYVPSAG